MARLPQPGKDAGTWGDVLNDYLVQSHDSSGQLRPDSVTTATITDGSVTMAKLAGSVQPSLVKADSALQAADIVGKLDVSAAASSYVPLAAIGIASGVASLDSGAKVLEAQLPARLGAAELSQAFATPSSVASQVSSALASIAASTASNSVWQGLRSRLAYGVDSFYVACIGDSTSAGPSKWFYTGFQSYFAQNHPEYSVLYRDEDQSTGLYGGNSAHGIYGGPAVIQHGTAGDAYIPMTVTSGCTISTPDRPFFNITDLDVRILVALDSWSTSTAHFVAKYSAIDGNRSWYMNMVSGKLAVFWTSTGIFSNYTSAGSSVVTGLTDGVPAWVRVTVKASTGTVTFYTAPVPAPGNPTVWTQLGTPVVKGAKSIYQGTAAINIGGIGAPNIAGKVYMAEVMNAIDGYPIVSFDASMIPPTQIAGSINFKDHLNNTWQSGSAVPMPIGAPAITLLNASISGASIASHSGLGPLTPTGITAGFPVVGLIRPASELMVDTALIVINEAHNDNVTGGDKNFISNPPSAYATALSSDVTFPLTGGPTIALSAALSGPYGMVVIAGVPVFYAGVSGNSITGCISYTNVIQTVTAGTAVYKAIVGYKEYIEKIRSLQPNATLAFVAQNPQYHPSSQANIYRQYAKVGQVKQLATAYNAGIIDFISLYSTPAITEALMSDVKAQTTASVTLPMSGGTIPVSTVTGLTVSVRTATDGVVVSGTQVLTSASAIFTALDVGKPISGTGIPANTTIYTVESATNVTTSAPSTGSGTGVTLTIGGGLMYLGPKHTITYTGTSGLTLTGVICADTDTVPSGTNVEFRDGVHPQFSAASGMPLQSATFANLIANR